MTAQLNGQPEAWVMSFDERPDRLAAFRRRAEAAQLNVQELIVPRCTVARDGWVVSPESCGNAQSHLQLLEAGDGPLLVFEDDAMLPPSLNSYIDHALNQLPTDWELCLLGAGQIVKSAAVISSNGTADLVLFTRFLYTHAYLVSERGRPHLADCARRATHHWDYLASRRMCSRRQTYGFYPTVIEQDPALGSDIPDTNAATRGKS